MNTSLAINMNVATVDALYLRKSRKDIELEREGQDDTLTRHRAMLLEFAAKNGLNIVKIYEEVVSGENIGSRPEMLRLLQDVEEQKYDSILCMDLDRLGRGSMAEQGIILEVFKKANTRIVTPRKVYDLNDEFDEEYSEFEAFMARKELKIIKRRLRRGIERSVDEGCIMGPTPYGYEKARIDNHPTMKPHPEHASIVCMIFDMYVNKSMGGQQIANKLNELGYKTMKGKQWVPPRIRNLLRNPVYMGKVVWKRRLEIISKDGVKTTKTNPREDWVLRDGLHEALVSEEAFEKAQEILKNRYNSPVPLFDGNLKNPLAGILRCGKCGYVMQVQYRKDRVNHYYCTHSCGNKSSQVDFVENRVVKMLEEWFSELELKNSVDFKADEVSNEYDVHDRKLNKIKQDLAELQNQKNRLHDLLERDIYDSDTFLSRSQNIVERIKELEQAELSVKRELEKSGGGSIEIDIPKYVKILNLYYMAETAEEKNRLLKSIVEKIEYFKEKSQRRDEFELKVFPRF